MNKIVENKYYDLAVVIGRFQLQHVGHSLLLNKAASVANNVLVIVGSAFQPRTIKNPFKYEERASLIRSHFESDNPVVKGINVTVSPLVDNRYSDDSWVKSVQEEIEKTLKGILKEHWCHWCPKVCIVGHMKDDSTKYLEWFPQYHSVSIDEFKLQMDATDIRSLYFSKPSQLILLGDIIPKPVQLFLNKFYETEHYPKLVEEYNFYVNYKQEWGVGPFITVDAIVKKAGHICLVKRGDNPGKDLWALPGGFLENNERLFDGCIRELYEETSIDLPPGLLRGSLVKSEVFDDPNRSLRGRIITHAYLFDLDNKDKKPGLPKIKAMSDAKETRFFTINEILGMGEVMFEDHLDIIKKMMGLE